MLDYLGVRFPYAACAGVLLAFLFAFTGLSYAALYRGARRRGGGGGGK